MSTFTCDRCGAKFGITDAPETPTDEDREAQGRYDDLVNWHESGECAPLRTDPIAFAKQQLGDAKNATGAATASGLASIAVAEELRTANLLAFAQVAPDLIDRRTALALACTRLHVRGGDDS